MRRMSVCWLLLTLLAGVGTGVAQFDLGMIKKTTTASGATATPMADWILDQPVDPAEYILGPGDLVGHLAFNVDLNRKEDLVDTDGRLELPGLGRVSVAGLSLLELRRRLGPRLAIMYGCDSVDVWVARPRRIQVTVSGADLVPRFLELNYTTRLHTVLKPPTWLPNFRGAAAQQMMVPSTSTSGALQQVSALAQEMPLAFRNVEVVRGDSALHVDLLRYLRTGDLEQDPVLESGDRILFSFRNSIVRVFGSFRQGQDEVEFREGDTPADIVEILGGPRIGLTGVAYELVRFDPFGNFVGNWRFSEQSPEYRGISIQAYDRLYMRADNLQDMSKQVTINGRVLRPGPYAINPGQTTLAELLEWAQPDSQSAALMAIKVTRRPEMDLERNFAELRSAGSDISRFEREYLKARVIQDGGRVSVVYENGRLDAAHLILADGDEVRVLRRSDDVEVLGAVKHPGVQAWRDGWTVRDYLKAAGGKLRGARLNELRLRHVGEDQFSPASLGTVMAAGDALMLVPREDLTAWEKFKEGLLVASQIMTVVLVARSI